MGHVHVLENMNVLMEPENDSIIVNAVVCYFIKLLVQFLDSDWSIE